MLRRSCFVHANRITRQLHQRGSLLAVAVDALHRQNQNKDSSSSSSSSTPYGLQSTAQTKSLWIDRDEERARAVTEHRQSEVYKELHRRPTQLTELGLYGGEPGFDRTSRVWVDPDNPHVRHIYNLAPLTVNSRWARYGHFKRELHIVDVDKLCRHARMVPPADKLLTDFTSGRVALDDDGCSAIVRHGARTLHHLVGANGHKSEQWFAQMQSVFERFLIAIAPPMYAGVRTHSDMIRLCSMMKNKWEEGFHQYRQRAVDEAADAKLRREELIRQQSSSRTRGLFPTGKKHRQESLIEAGDYSHDALLDPALSPLSNDTRILQRLEFEGENDDEEGGGNKDALADDPSSSGTTARALAETSESDRVVYRAHNSLLFELDSEFYDAVIELCVVHEQHKECISQLYELIESRHRPRITSLTNALISATILGNTTVGDDIPRLVELYRLRPDVKYFEARAAYCSLVRPAQTWSNLLDALTKPIADTGHVLKPGVAGMRAAAQILERSEYNQFGDASTTSSASAAAAASFLGDTNSHDTSFNSNRYDGRQRVKMPTSRTVSWSIVGLANNDECTAGGEVLKMLDLAASRSIACDYEQLTFALYFACKKATRGLIGGEQIFSFVRDIVHDRLATMRVNITPEMALLAVRALARSHNNGDDGGLLTAATASASGGGTSLLSASSSLALEILSFVESTNNRSSSHFPSIFYELYQLLARTGAMASFSSTLRAHVLARGETVHSWLLRTWLWCNSNADKPNGNHMMTSEAVEFLMMMGRSSNGNNNSGDSTISQELIVALSLCRMKHGKFPPSVEKTLESILLDSPSDDEKDDEEPQQSPSSNSDLAAEATTTVLDMIEYFSCELFSNIGKQQQQQRVPKHNSSISSGIPSSLEESLASLSLLDYSDGQSKTDLADRRRQHLSSLVASSGSCYDACSSIAQGVIQYADAVLRKNTQPDDDSPSPSPSSSSSENYVIRDEHEAGLVGFAQIFAGLPSEKSDAMVKSITAEFDPTPSDLRELKATWTMDAYDVFLRRQGQYTTPSRMLHRSTVLPHALPVTPFHENLK